MSKFVATSLCLIGIGFAPALAAPFGLRSVTLASFGLSLPGVSAAQREPLTITVVGRREPAEASVSVKAMKYIPFDTPSGVTRLVIHKEFDHGAHPELKNTVDLGLFDPGGYGEGGPGFRAWQGGSPDDLIVAGTVEASSPHAIPGPIPAGTWHLAQYFLKSTPEGLGYKYTITFYFDGEKPPQNRVPVPAYSAGVIRRKTSWYAGNMHAHTIHSDGGYTLDNLVARNERAGFDFLASTEHNSPTAHYRFAEVGRDHPDHLLLCGDELTTPSGHANIIGQPPGKFYDFRIDAGDGKLSRRIDEVHRDGGFFTVNHPFAPCTSCFWKYYDDEWKEADAIEVWNNLWTPEDRLAVDKWDSLLKAGRRISAIGGTDYHRGEDMMSPATLIFAPELSRRAILDNLRRGHIILTQSPRSGIECNFALNNRDVLPGDEITVKGDTISLAMALTVRCKNNSDAPKKLRLIYATGERSFDLNATETKLTLDIALPMERKSDYLRAEITDGNGNMQALTNPVYIKRKAR